MAFSLDRIKRDFAKHRAKTGVLCVLSVLMIAFVVKGAMEMRPRSAVAESPAAVTPASLTSDPAGETTADADERIRQSRELWNVLREKRGMDAQTAFTFDASYYPLDPTQRTVAEPEHAEPIDRTPAVAVNNEDAERQARLRGIKEQARGLVVRSTVVGSGNNSRPVAVINERILTVGDYISGFEITAIRAREVEFKKDGTTLAVKMADDTHGQ